MTNIRSMTFRCLASVLWLSIGWDIVASEVQLLEQAVQTYADSMDLIDVDQRRQGFQTAEQLFRQVAGQTANAELRVNIGNAALQAGRLGPAIVAYRRALQLDPDHAQAQQNLVFARTAVPELYRQESAQGLIDTLFFWRSMLTREQTVGLAGVCFLFAALCLASGIAKKLFLLRNLAVLPLLCWCVLLASVYAAANGDSKDDAVVVADELVVHAADSENSSTRFSTALTSGVEVRILRDRGRWVEVEVAGGRSGWVLASGIDRILEDVNVTIDAESPS